MELHKCQRFIASCDILPVLKPRCKNASRLLCSALPFPSRFNVPSFLLFQCYPLFAQQGGNVKRNKAMQGIDQEALGKQGSLLGSLWQVPLSSCRLSVGSCEANVG